VRLRWAERKWGRLHALFIAYPIFIVATLLPYGVVTRVDIVLAGVAALAAIVAGISYLQILLPSRQSREVGAEYRLDYSVVNAPAAWGIALLVWSFGVLSILAIVRAKPLMQLMVALVASISPLFTNLFGSSIKLNRRVRGHLPWYDA
jgi:hypothetical protein